MCYQKVPTSKDFTALNDGWVHLQHTRIAVVSARWSFLLFLSLKTIKKMPAGKCDSYTRMLQINPPEDWLKTGWARDSQTSTRLVDSLLFHVFARERCILCFVLCHLTLPYVTSLRDSFCLGTFAHGFIRLSPCSLASSQGCSLAIIHATIGFFWISHGYWSSLSS